MKRLLSKAKGFTLAELLIALAILGVIATFTIPKVLTSSSDSQNKAIAKEVAGMISGAYTGYTLQNSWVPTQTALSVLTDSINYVKISTSAADSDKLGCNTAGRTCLVLHSGAVVAFTTTETFGAAANYVSFKIDPDGARTSMEDGSFALYYNGRLTTGANATGTAGTGDIGVITPDEAYMQF